MKEWYLTTPHPNITSGYENDAIKEYAQHNFQDVLETLFSDTVTLFNSSLTESKEIQCVIQGNTVDSQSKSMERSILAPIGTVHSGDYIYFEDEYWIVDGRPGNNKSYEKATLKECQYKLRWQKDDGTIVERWANLTSYANDIGEAGNNTIILSQGTITIIIPHDADGMTIENKRIFIDTSDHPTKVFKITCNQDALYVHGNHGATLKLIADKTELNMDTDNQALRICDYVDKTDASSPLPSLKPDYVSTLNATISGIKNLKVGFSRTYTVNFTDENNREVDWNEVDFRWNVVSDFEVSQTIDNQTIQLFIGDENYIGSTLVLQVIVDNMVAAEINVSVTGAF